MLQNQQQSTTVLDSLFEQLPEETPADMGEYDPVTQTWSHRDAAVMSPTKHNRES